MKLLKRTNRTDRTEHHHNRINDDTDAFRASTILIVLIFLLIVGLAMLPGCAPSNDPPPARLKLPEPILMEPPKALANLPATAKGNAPMVQHYAQCRLAHADEAQRRLGLIGYVKAARGAK
jgi:hypothetical protein